MSNLRQRARKLAQKALFDVTAERIKNPPNPIGVLEQYILQGMREALGEADEGMFAVDAPPIERPGDFATTKYRRGIWTAMARKRLEGIE